MSHYAVAVFTDGTQTVDELLEPFCENVEVEPYISRTRQEIIERGREIANRAKEKLSNGRTLSSDEREAMECKTDDDFYAFARYEDYAYDEDGNELTTYNPQSKWDWYEIGGRFSHAFDVFGVDPAGTKVGDIKTYFDQPEYAKSARFWELYVDGEEPVSEEEKELIRFAFYNREYYIDRYKDKKTYARCCASFNTYSVLLPDGTWEEPGEMGWWGMSSESHEDGLAWELNYVDKYLKSVNPDWTLTIVDCHI